MEIKRDKSLKLFFLQFLGKTLLYVVIAFVIWITTMILIVGNGNGILPANETEEQIRHWKESCEDSGTYDFSDFPDRAGYVLYENDLVVASGRMSERQLENADKLVHSSDYQYRSLFDVEQLQKLEQNNQICIVRYAIRAEFANESLRKIIPNIDILLVILLIIDILAAVTLAILQTSKKMSKEVLLLKKASQEIQDQNLDFTIQSSKIKEFNQVLSALDDLKKNLSVSLETQWKLEQEKKQQMSALAHDIKTPLTIINGNSELLLESELDQEQKQFTQSIYQSTEQIQKYVKQIIDLSKDQVLSIQVKNHNTNELINNFYDDAVNFAQPKKIILEKEVEDNLPLNISTDLDALHRVYMNLLDNAMQFTPENGKVRICFYMEHGEVNHQFCFSVEDSGPGFSSDAIAHAKQQFYQADASRTSREHFGMGLFIADQIVTALNGQLILTNEPQSGAKVTVKLPMKNC